MLIHRRAGTARITCPLALLTAASIIDPGQSLTGRRRWGSFGL